MFKRTTTTTHSNNNRKYKRFSFLSSLRKFVKSKNENENSFNNNKKYTKFNLFLDLKEIAKQRELSEQYNLSLQDIRALLFEVLRYSEKKLDQKSGIKGIGFVDLIYSSGYFEGQNIYVNLGDDVKRIVRHFIKVLIKYYKYHFRRYAYNSEKEMWDKISFIFVTKLKDLNEDFFTLSLLNERRLNN